MKFWKRLWGAKPEEQVLEYETSLVTHHPEMLAVLREKFVEHKAPIALECMDRVISGGAIPDERRAEWVALLAADMTLSALSDEEQWVQLSEHERVIAADIAQDMIDEDQWRPIIAETLWWLGQLAVAQGWNASTDRTSVEAIEAAIRYLERATKLQEDPRYYGTLANTYMAAKDFQRAYEYASRAVAIEPEYVEGYRLLGANAWMLGKIAEADRAFTEGLKRNPQEPFMLVSLQDLRAGRRPRG
jgi:tetratricopeptide (TPR) repeat protein